MEVKGIRLNCPYYTFNRCCYKAQIKIFKKHHIRTRNKSLITVGIQMLVQIPFSLIKSLYMYFIYRIFEDLRWTRAPRGTDRSPENNEHFYYKLDSRVKNLTTEWNQTQQHFITHASRSLLWIGFVAVAFRSEEEVFWRRGPPPPVTYFVSNWICPWANMAKTSLCMCRAMSTSSLPSFVNIH